MQQGDGIDELVGIFVLIAEPENGDGLAGPVLAFELRHELQPAGRLRTAVDARQFAVAECRCAENQRRVRREVADGGAIDIHRRGGGVAEFLRDQFGDPARTAGIGAEENADPVHDVGVGRSG